MPAGALPASHGITIPREDLFSWRKQLIVNKLQPLRGDPDAPRALTILHRDFLDPDGVGPSRVAAFLTGGHDDELQADVVGFFSQLLDAVGKQ